MFEQVAHPDDLADVLEVLASGAPAGFDPARAAVGPGAGWVMLPFLRPRPSRFSDGHRYGVFYAGRREATAIAESTFHYARFLAAPRPPSCTTRIPNGAGRPSGGPPASSVPGGPASSTTACAIRPASASRCSIRAA